MTGTPLEEMMSSNLSMIVNDPLILAIIVLGCFGIFALMQGSGLDRKVAIIVPAAFLAVCLVPWLLLILCIIIGSVFIYPVLRRFFG